MRIALFSAIVIGLISFGADPSQAQQPAAPAGTGAQAPSFGANASRYGMAVVDISFIFKNYPRFTQQIEALKTDMEAADGQLKADRDRLAQMEDQRNALKPGSAEFKQLDEDLARQKADFSIKQGTIRRDFLEREAKIYYQTYLEVSNGIKTYAQRNNIGMVLRFNGDPIDPGQREDVMRAIMQPIVYENNVDITPDVCGFMGIPLKPGAQVQTARPPATTQTR